MRLRGSGVAAGMKRRCSGDGGGRKRGGAGKVVAVSGGRKLNDLISGSNRNAGCWISS